MSATKILWGQIAAVFLIVLAAIWSATQWTASALAYQPALGPPWFMVGDWPIYPPPAFYWWWFSFDAYAPDIFQTGAYIAASGGLVSIAVAIGMSVWRARELKNAETYGSARWASEKEIRRAGLLGNDGVVLGQFGRTYLRHDGPEHVLCYAPTRSGKGVGLVVPSLLTWPGSAIVHDIKGENWTLTAGFRAQHGRVLLFDPTNALSAAYNPLLEVRRGQWEVRDVQNVADVLVDPEGSLERRNHWEKTSHALLVGAILHVLYAEPDKTLAGVAAFLSDPARPIETTLDRMMATPHLGEAGIHPVIASAELRREIAGHLAVSRGINCSVFQVVVTGGYSAGLGLALSVLRLAGQTVWVEEPGFLWSRKGLELAGLSLAPIPVDSEGIDVEYGLRHHPDARLVVVTPGQQAPLGTTLSLERRLRLLEWANENEAWIIEDDYLSDLQLSGRAAPAIASLDSGGRVIHIGSFSKTLSPTIRLGFVVAPPELATRFAEVAACLAPPPGPAIQLATAEFMREGHYMRHLRRTKRAYAAKRKVLLECLRGSAAAERVTAAGLAVLLKLPKGTSDVAVARELSAFGMSPSPLSAWYSSDENAESGLLLGVATTPTRNVARSCVRLFEVIRRFTDLPER